MDERIPYLGLHAVTIYVRDQDRSLRFYLDQLGFHLAFDAKLQDGERWVALDEKLPAILRGAATAKDAREQIGLASLCVNHRKCYAAAARFYAAAFLAQPELAGDLSSGQ